MSALIVYLPPAAPGANPDYRYAQTRDGQAVFAHGSASAATLPATGVGQDVVAIVPGRMLSWHVVDLPKGTLNGGATRLRAVLEGLLEDRLLDEPQNLHFALAPQASPHALPQASSGGTSNTPPSSPNTYWVGVCDKAWLRAALAPLEAAARPVSRIVPEFAPVLTAATDGAEDSLHALGEPGDAWLVHAHALGVSVLPLLPVVAQELMARPTRPTVLAEPAVAALANHLFQNQVMLQQAPERWVLALQSPWAAWDLAQFDLANSGRQRTLKKISDWGSDLLRAPRWRAARWGAALLIAANLVGLNAWAWKEKSALAQRRGDVQAVLTQTFPQVKVVIDAPVQMSREVALLRQAAGAASRQDLENLLTAVGSVAPPATATTTLTDFSQVDYSEGELRLKGPSVKDGRVQDLVPRLQAVGYQGRLEGDTLAIKPTGRPESTAGGRL